MNCVKCGEVCRCPMESTANRGSNSDSTPPVRTEVALGLEAEAAMVEPEGTAWREEISARLHRYRTRRKALPPRYPSLRLPFDAVDPSVRDNAATENSHPPIFEPRSDHALALDGSHLEASVASESGLDP